MDSFNKYIIQERKRRDWTQTTLASKADCSQSAIQAIESGSTESMRVKTLVNIAKAFNIDPVKLLLIYEGRDPNEYVKNDAGAKHQLFGTIVEAVQDRLGQDDARKLMQEFINNKDG